MIQTSIGPSTAIHDFSQFLSSLTSPKCNLTMHLVKQKTFEFPDSLVASFEEFCRTRMLVEKRIAAAAVHHLMTNMSADERERLLVEYEKQFRAEYEEAAKAKRAGGVKGSKRRGPS